MATEAEIIAAKAELKRRQQTNASVANVEAAKAELASRQPELSWLEKGQRIIDGTLDVARVVGSSIAAEPIAGFGGMSDNFRLNQEIGPDGNITNPFPDQKWRPTTPNERGQTVDALRDQVTLSPETKGGTAALGYVGEKLEPAAEMLSASESYLGDTTKDLTGSDKAAAVATTIPTAIMEIGPLGVARKIAQAARRAKGAPFQREIDKTLAEATPTKEALKASSTKHFNDIDQMGVTINQNSFSELIGRAETAMKGRGGSARVTPEAWSALGDMQDTLKRIEAGESVPLGELEELREIASVAADTPAQPKKQAVALAIVDEIDDFIESATPDQFNMPAGVNPTEVGAKYKLAREQWGGYRRSQMLDKATLKAGDQASGFENGLRIQFRQILNSEKKSKFFKTEELAAMRQVVNGTGSSNLLKVLGKAGVDFGGGNNALLAMITGLGTYGVSQGGIAGFSAALGIVGASSVAKKLAERMTKLNSDFANQVIRSGTDARKITEVYLRNTPKELRSMDELSLLLMNKNIDLSSLQGHRIAAEAAELALTRRTQLATALAAGSSTGKNPEPENKP